MSVSKRVALVTGANRGIGAAVVRELLKAGASKVYATARDVKSLPNVGDSRVVPLQLDVLSDESVRKAAAAAKDVDLLVNNAGSLAFGDYISSSWDTFESDMQANYFGTLRVVRAFSPQFIARKSGTIANVVSIVGLSAVPPMAGYSASKAAVHSLTQSIRGSLEAHQIKVIGIYPGPVDTKLAAQIPLDKVTPELVATNIVQAIEQGETYVFPDPMAQQVHSLWTGDILKLEHVSLHIGG